MAQLSWEHRFFPVGVVALLSISPLLWIPLLPGASRYDNQRLLEFLCVGMAGVLLVLRCMSGRLPGVSVRGRLLAAAAAVAVLGGISAGLAYSPRHAGLEWGNTMLLVGLAWLVADSVRWGGEASLDRLLRLCGIGCAVYLVLVGAACMAALSDGGATRVEQLLVGFDNYRFFNHVQTATLPLLGLLAARQSRPSGRIWWGLTSAWWALVCLSAARGTAVGALVGLSCAAVLAGPAGRRWTLCMGLSALAGVGLYLLFFVAAPMLRGMEPIGLFFGVVERSLASPDSGRLTLWREAWGMVVAQPWLGAGPLHFAHAARELDSGADPHSWVLQIASEWGVPALILMLACAGMVFRSLWQVSSSDSPRDDCTRAAWIALFVAAMVDGLVSSLFVVPTAQLWLAWSAGCAWGWCALRRAGSMPGAGACHVTPQVSRAPVRLAIGIVAALALWGVIHGAGPEARDLAGHRARAGVTERPGAVYWPRIWLNGFF